METNARVNMYGLCDRRDLFRAGSFHGGRQLEATSEKKKRQHH
jgi:hypothetical protein